MRERRRLEDFGELKCAEQVEGQVGITGSLPHRLEPTAQAAEAELGEGTRVPEAHAARNKPPGARNVLGRGTQNFPRTFFFCYFIPLTPLCPTPLPHRHASNHRLPRQREGQKEGKEIEGL